MKRMQIIKALLLLSIISFSITCNEAVTEPNEIFLEPEMIMIEAMVIIYPLILSKFH